MMTDRLMTPAEVAAMLGLTEKTLANWRSSGGRGLPFRKHGGRVMYARSAVEDFSASHTRQHTRDGGPAA